MRQKGSSFEREICRQLSIWWTQAPDTDVLFWRTSQSGGRATQRAKSKKKTTRAHCGDICALDERGKPLTDLIAWEVKRGYPKASIHSLLDRTDDSAEQIYERWVKQAQEAAKQAGVAFWAIVHKRNRCTTTLTVPYKLWIELDLDSPDRDGGIIHPPVIEMEVMMGDKKEYLVSCQFDAFLGFVCPNAVRKCLLRQPTASSVSVLPSVGA